MSLESISEAFRACFCARHTNLRYDREHLERWTPQRLVVLADVIYCAHRDHRQSVFFAQQRTGG